RVPPEGAGGATAAHGNGYGLAPDGDGVRHILQAHVEGGGHALVAHVLDRDDDVHRATPGDGARRRDARDREVRNGRGRWRSAAVHVDGEASQRQVDAVGARLG